MSADGASDAPEHDAAAPEAETFKEEAEKLAREQQRRLRRNSMLLERPAFKATDSAQAASPWGDHTGAAMQRSPVTCSSSSMA